MASCGGVIYAWHVSPLALLRLVSPSQHLQAYRSFALFVKTQHFRSLRRKIDDDTPAPGLRVHHHLIMAQSMAFQNATWLVETAKCGAEDGYRMFGHSLIVAPTGEIAAQSLTEDDEVICFNADIDMARNLKRTMFDFAAHRRPEHYRLIVERTGAEVTPAEGP